MLLGTNVLEKGMNLAWDKIVGQTGCSNLG